MKEKYKSEYRVAESIGAPGTEEEYYERVKMTPEEIAAEKRKNA